MKKYIENKIKFIELYIQHLDIITNMPMEELKKDFIRYYAMERVFQLIIDEMSDINGHVIKHLNVITPNDFQSTFKTLAENSILPEDFALRIAPAVGLRNRLVHRYEDVDKNLVLKMIYKEKDDFKKFIKLIEKYLRNK